MKGLPLILFAILIDLMQLLMSLALLGLLGSLSTIPVLGQVVGTVSTPLGFVLGIAISMSISLTAGVGHTFAFILTYSTSASSLKTKIEGMILRRVTIMMLGEVIPMINNLPWMTIATLLTLWSIHRHKKKAEAEGQTLGEKPASKTQQQPAGGRFVGNEVAAAAFALLLCFGLAPFVHAQSAVPPPVQYMVVPETPGPKTSTTVEVQGVGSFLGDATITWTQDGKTVKQGVGVRSYTFTTGVLGQKTTVEVAVDSSQGFFSKTFSFNPSKINLLWEADTSVPLQYLGRALYSAGSNYKVVAFPTVYSPSGVRVAQSALSYQWSFKGDYIPEASGTGRTTFIRTGDQLQAGEDISLEVYYGTTKVAATSLYLAAAQPKIVLYPRDPLRGELLESALPAGISLNASEITMQAEPYYFAQSALRTGQAPFTWTINGEAAAGPDSAQGILTLRQTGSGSGAAQVGVSIQNNNPDQFVQTATTGLQLVFGQQTGNALLDFFGL